jgi:hypothetical protein
VGIVSVLIFTESELLVVLNLLLVGSVQLFVSFGGGVVDSLVEGGNFLFEVGNLSIGLVEFVVGLFFGSVVFLDPMLIVSSFDFSGLGNLFEELVAKGDDVLDGGLVSLDWGGGGDTGEHLEECVPGLSLEFLLLGGLQEMFRDISEGDLA